jgi:hypothetical protein
MSGLQNREETRSKTGSKAFPSYRIFSLRWKSSLFEARLWWSFSSKTKASAPREREELTAEQKRGLPDSRKEEEEEKKKKKPKHGSAGHKPEPEKNEYWKPAKTKKRKGRTGGGASCYLCT